MQKSILEIAAENAIHRLEEIEHFAKWNNQQWIMELRAGIAAQHCVNADSGDSHPAENLPTPGVSRAQEGGR